MPNVVEILIQGRDKFSPHAKKAQTSAGGLKGAMGGLGKMAVGVGAGFIAAQASIAGVQKIMSASIGAAMKFEHQMAQIRGLTGATREDTDLLEGSIKDMARAMPKSPAELGAGAYFIISAGITDAAEAANVLEISAKASAAGLGETKVVADAVTSALNAYKMGAGEAERMTDILTTTVRLGKTEASALAGSIGRILPVAAAMGVSFEEVGANLAVMTKVGLSADEAATSLRATMTQLLNPTAEAEEALAALGLSGEGLREQIREKGLLAALSTLMDKTGGNTAEIVKIIPNVRALVNVLGTVGSQAETYADTLDQMNRAQGATETAFGEVADTAQFKTQRAIGELNVVLMELGQEVLPFVAAGAEKTAGALGLLVGAVEAIIWPYKQMDAAAVSAGDTTRDFLGLTIGLDNAIERQRGTLVADILAMREGRQTTADIAKETAEFDTQVAALASRLGLEEKLLRDSGLSMGELKDKTKELDDLIALMPASWQAFDKEVAKGAMLQAQLEGAIGDTGTKAAWMSGVIEALTASLKGASAAQKEMMSTLSGITGQRTQETNALDQQINALELEQNAALQAEIGQERLGGAVGSTTSALDRQMGALDNLAASMVPQALNNEVIALGRELKVLELGKLQIEAQINARNRLATAQLAMARIANLPAMLKQKELELAREKILQKVGGETDKLSKKDKARLDAINGEMDALSRSIQITTLEAEIKNLSAEASDKNREAMQRELNKINDQIGATGDLSRKRELYIDTLIPVQLLQDIDALGRQKSALDNSKAGAEGATGATRTLSDTIGDQVRKLGLQRDAIDLVTEGWRLQAEAMAGLPSLADIRNQLLAFKGLLLLQTQQSMLDALGRLDLGAVAKLTGLLGRIAAFQPAQHGYHGDVTRPTLFLAGEAGQKERVDITPGGGGGGGRAVEMHFHFDGPILGDERQAMQFARMILPEIRRQVAA